MARHERLFGASYVNIDDVLPILKQTLEDGVLSRGEKKALSEHLIDLEMSSHDRNLVRKKAFEIAGDKMKGRDNLKTLEWIEDVVKLLQANAAPKKRPVQSASYFSPGDDCIKLISDLFFQARRSADVCVFTITSNRIADAIHQAHRRGVKVRIVTDDDKSYDQGSDVFHLAGSGVPVRIDNSESHMHHKFAVFDKKKLVSGSYNWTRAGAERNQENIILTDDPGLAESYLRVFEQLWREFS